MVVHNVAGSSYHVNNRLFDHWNRNSIKNMKKYNSDRVYIVDGTERTGKSWFTIQQAGVIDPKMFESVEKFLSRICFTPEEFFKAVRTVTNGVIIFDEAFRGFSSRSALSKTNKKLVQALMEMGQNNNIVFIVLPSFFLLDIYPAMLRSHGLFNIYLDKRNGKRVWRGYNKVDKNFIFQNGLKRGWSYPKKTLFRGNFYSKFPGGEEFEKAYTKKKRDALIEMDKVVEEEPYNRFKNQRDVIINNMRKEYNLTAHQLSLLLKKWKVPMSATHVNRIFRAGNTITVTVPN